MISLHRAQSQPLQTYPSEHLAQGGGGDKMLDGQRQIIGIPTHAGTAQLPSAHTHTQKKKMEKGLCWVVPRVYLRRPSTIGHKELTRTELWSLTR